MHPMSGKYVIFCTRFKSHLVLYVKNRHPESKRTTSLTPVAYSWLRHCFYMCLTRMLVRDIGRGASFCSGPCPWASSLANIPGHRPVVTYIVNRFCGNAPKRDVRVFRCRRRASTAGRSFATSTAKTDPSSFCRRSCSNR